MAKIHILTASQGLYDLVIHVATPAGNNSAGISWKNVIIGAGRNTTRLTEGNGAGQITTVEKASIIAGDLIEIATSVPAESGGTTAQQLTAGLDLLATARISEALALFQKQYKYFGYTQG